MNYNLKGVVLLLEVQYHHVYFIQSLIQPLCGPIWEFATFPKARFEDPQNKMYPF